MLLRGKAGRMAPQRLPPRKTPRQAPRRAARAFELVKLNKEATPSRRGDYFWPKIPGIHFRRLLMGHPVAHKHYYLQTDLRRSDKHANMCLCEKASWATSQSRDRSRMI